MAKILDMEQYARMLDIKYTKMAAEDILLTVPMNENDLRDTKDCIAELTKALVRIKKHIYM
jgi:hypothetical protein